MYGEKGRNSMVLKCEMCGYNVEVLPGENKATCASCGSLTALQTQATGGAERLEPLMKRIALSLEYDEWEKAADLLEQALNIDPENAKLYVALLMTETKSKKEENLADFPGDISAYLNYQKALRFADEGLAKRLEQYNRAALERKRQAEEQEAKRQMEIEEEKAAEKKQEEKRGLFFAGILFAFFVLLLIAIMLWPR